MLIDYERDRRNDIKSYREEGIEEGMEKGLEKGKLITVQNLIRETTFNNQKIAFLAAVEESVVRRARSEMIHV